MWLTLKTIFIGTLIYLCMSADGRLGELSNRSFAEMYGSLKAELAGEDGGF